MCTVSLVPTVRGVRLACNRDEQRARPVARPPTIRVLGGRRAIFPQDPQGGGTWAGVNDAGLAATLLNYHPVGYRRTQATRPVTRGRIVPSLLAADAVDEALALVSRLDATMFLPFRLVVIDGRRVALVTSDARSVAVERLTLVGPLMFTSSSLGDALVERPRRRLFDRLMAGPRQSWVDAQRAFHVHRWSRRPELSVLMTRSDAMTVSHCAIQVREPGLVTCSYQSYHDPARAIEQVWLRGTRRGRVA